MADDDVRRAAALEHHPLLSVLVHPDDDPRHPDARRIICRVVTPGEWPWMRLTGAPVDIPKQGADLTAWQPQPLGDLAVLLHHAVVLSGHTVGP